MKAGKKFRVLCSAVALLPLLSVGSVAAVTNTTTATDVKTTLTERLEQRRTALATKLSTAQANRLKLRCQAAQTKLNTVNERAQTATTNRITAFNAIHTNLTRLVTRLGGQVDTQDLQAALETLSTKIDGFETDSSTYKQTLADVLAMDCTTDPTSFRASLDTAKTQQAALITDAAAIRTYLNETIKPLLQTIRTSLQAKEGNS